jgi:hypothetical protein
VSLRTEDFPYVFSLRLVVVNLDYSAFCIERDKALITFNRLKLKSVLWGRTRHVVDNNKKKQKR